MKLITNIYKAVWALAIPCCMLTGCNYLDVIPPAQPDFEDTMKDEARTLEFYILVMDIFHILSLLILNHLNNRQMKLLLLLRTLIISNKLHGGQFLLLITIVGEEMT